MATEQERAVRAVEKYPYDGLGKTEIQLARIFGLRQGYVDGLREGMPVRLTPEFRASLIDYARNRIQAVWDDAGSVTAQVLAENVVAAWDFAQMAEQVGGGK